MNEPLHITIDTREQRPWAFPPNLARATVGTLRTGDYALAGDTRFAIERKSLDDFLGTIGSGWERFLREIGRMEGAGFVARVVVVEADYESCCFHLTEDGELEPPRHNHPKLDPAFVNRRIAELLVRWNVSVVFAGNSQYAGALALSILRRRAEQIEEGDEAR